MDYILLIQAKIKNAKLLHEVPHITPEIENMAGGAGTSMGTGGMSTKNQSS